MVGTNGARQDSRCAFETPKQGARAPNRWRKRGWVIAVALVLLPFLTFQVMSDARSAFAEILIIVLVIAGLGITLPALRPLTTTDA